jgi:FTR1 family protein
MGIFLIAFRDFIESFIFLSILLGFSKKEGLNKEKLIIMGGGLGLFISITLPILSYFILPFVKTSISEEIVETISHSSVILSGLLLLFISYTIHPFIIGHKDKHLSSFLSGNKLNNLSFFLVSLILVLGEGLEILLFTTTISFYRTAALNSLLLLLGLGTALLVGLVVYKTYLKNHIKNLFKITEILIIAYGIYLIAHGLLEFLE